MGVFLQLLYTLKENSKVFLFPNFLPTITNLSTEGTPHRAVPAFQAYAEGTAPMLYHSMSMGWCLLHGRSRITAALMKNLSHSPNFLSNGLNQRGQKTSEGSWTFSSSLPHYHGISFKDSVYKLHFHCNCQDSEATFLPFLFSSLQ